jgi:hypothetical protein
MYDFSSNLGTQTYGLQDKLDVIYIDLHVIHMCLCTFMWHVDTILSLNVGLLCAKSFLIVFIFLA